MMRPSVVRISVLVLVLSFATGGCEDVGSGRGGPPAGDVGGSITPPGEVEAVTSPPAVKAG